LSYKRRYVI